MAGASLFHIISAFEGFIRFNFDDATYVDRSPWAMMDGAACMMLMDSGKGYMVTCREVENWDVNTANELGLTQLEFDADDWWCIADEASELFSTIYNPKSGQSFCLQSTLDAQNGVTEEEPDGPEENQMTEFYRQMREDLEFDEYNAV